MSSLNATTIDAFYAKAIQAIRGIDKNHIIFLEPANMYSKTFPVKDNIVWSPHYYPLSFAPKYFPHNITILEADLAAKYGKFLLEMGSPMWIGEFGAFMDAISIHAYPYNLNQGRTWDYYKQLWTQELSQYKRFGKPIWLTETGLRSTQNSEADQATYLTNSYQFFKDQGVTAFIWYMLKDYVSSNGDTVSFGLATVDSTTKLSYGVYKSLVTT